VYFVFNHLEFLFYDVIKWYRNESLSALKSKSLLFDSFSAWSKSASGSKAIKSNLRKANNLKFTCPVSVDVNVPDTFRFQTLFNFKTGLADLRERTINSITIHHSFRNPQNFTELFVCIFRFGLINFGVGRMMR